MFEYDPDEAMRRIQKDADTLIWAVFGIFFVIVCCPVIFFCGAAVWFHFFPR